VEPLQGSRFERLSSSVSQGGAAAPLTLVYVGKHLRRIRVTECHGYCVNWERLKLRLGTHFRETLFRERQSRALQDVCSQAGAWEQGVSFLHQTVQL